MSTDTARPARQRKPKTSAAEQKRIAKGLPLSATPPELSATRRINAAMAAVTRWAPNDPKHAAAIMAENLSKNLSIQGVASARGMACEASPSVVRRLVEISQGGHKAGVRDQIAAGRLVLEVAGVMDRASASLGEDAPLSQQSVGMLRQVIASGEERIRQLEAAIHEREVSTVSEIPNAGDVAAPGE